MKKVFGLLTIFLSIFISSEIYAYKTYKVGDKLIYNGVDYYVIRDSSSDKDYVTLLKAEPLTVEEVNKYGNGHVNRNTVKSVGTAFDINGYGGVAFYSSDDCSYKGGGWHYSGCKTNYDESDIKYIVDAWATDVFEDNLLSDESGYKQRLLSKEDLINYLGMNVDLNTVFQESNSDFSKNVILNKNYKYWAKDTINFDYMSSVSVVTYEVFDYFKVASYNILARPVVNLNKKIADLLELDDMEELDDNKELLEDVEKDNSDNKGTEKLVSNNNKSKTIVNVPNTLKSVSGLIILIGMVLTCVGLNIFMIVKNIRSNK